MNRVRLITKLLVLAVLVMTAWLPGLYAAAQGDGMVEGSLDQIDAFLTQLVAWNQFSGAVLIARGDAVLLNQGYGLANRAWDVPNTPQTRFRIGNLTAQFTAMAILMLQDQGHLSVHDPICQFLDGCLADWQNITIHDVLTHTSGLPDVPTSPQLDYEAGNRREAVKSFMAELPITGPGERMWWSDGGYWLLGEIIAKVSGRSYVAFLQENIFNPLGMNDTGYDFPNSVMPNRAEGYMAGFKQTASYTNMQVRYAAGGLYSTVEDLYRWAQALFTGQVVSSEAWEAMLAEAVPVNDQEEVWAFVIKRVLGLDHERPAQIAYGMAAGSREGRPVITYYGFNFVQGFRSGLMRFTDDGLTIIVLSNLDSAQIDYLTRVMVRMLSSSA